MSSSDSDSSPSSLGEQVKEELSCSICLELFTRPKVLPCQHTFCQDCLIDHVGVRRHFLCPICRIQVDLSPLGVSGLPDNHLVSSLCERLGSQVGISAGKRRPSKSANRCASHPLEDLKVFCKKCELPICELCLETVHDGHPTTTLKKASLGRTFSFDSTIAEGRNLLETYCNFLRDLRDTEKKLNEQKLQTDGRISYVYDQMVEKLTETRHSLLSEVEQRHRANLETIQEQRDAILAKVNELSAACDDAEKGVRQEGVKVFHFQTHLSQVMNPRISAPDSAQVYSVAVFLPADSPVPKLGQVGVQPFPSVSAACGRGAQIPTVERQVEVFPIVDLTVPTAEQLVIPRSLSPSLSNTEVKGLYTEVTGQNTEVKGLNTGVRDLTIEVKGLNTEVMSQNADVKGQIAEVKGQNTEVKFRRQRRRSFELRKLTFGGKGSEAGQFDVPCGVAVSEEGEVFVADCGNRRVQVFTLGGTFLRQFPTAAAPDGRTIQPDDVAVDTDDHIWVVGIDVAARYTKLGTLLRTVELRNTGWDRGVAMDTRTNNILVSQTTIDKRDIVGEVQIFGRDGEIVKTVGAQQGMKNPAYITVDGKGNILVSDNVSHYVYVLNHVGYLLLKFGGEGGGEGQLKCPSGICTDGSGNVIVADTRNSRVEMFDKTGAWVRHVAMGMRGPLAVAMAPQGQLVVTDSSDNTVTIFHSY
ncbi:PREDICTED: tripartite motif-containing protein 2-like [Branchiostoma belcheri]|uniref:RING-type E3 ubiquitin transferase n=1 Tax=Branchiostoma belcheri TaxID=7741 RepID=A0A6P4YQW3_BRABE|nr:PREDICTED: tripartite motif-containing protein 2-like [Branchiostoma belcheri]